MRLIALYSYFFTSTREENFNAEPEASFKELFNFVLFCWLCMSAFIDFSFVSCYDYVTED